MKAAFINYSLFGGGAERNIINLAPYFNRRAVKTDIILFKNLNDYQDEYPGLEKKVTIIPLLKMTGKIPFFLKPFYAVIVLARLVKAIRQHNYDLLIAAEEYDPFFVTAALARLMNKKSLLLVGNNIRYELRLRYRFLHPFYRLLFLWSFALADQVICVSKGLERDLEEHFPSLRGKLTTVYNGVDGKTIQRKAVRPLTALEKRYFVRGQTIVAIGRLVDKKGFDMLLRSFARVKNEVPGARLIIIGKGPLRETLATLATQLKIDGSVIFSGFIKDNPYRVISRAQVFVFPSRYEGFGNTILEALNCGLPVISTNCPYGPGEILTPGSGLLTPAVTRQDSIRQQNSKEAGLARLIVSLLRSKRLRDKYRRAGLKRANAFTLDIMGENYLRVMRKLINAL